MRKPRIQLDTATALSFVGQTVLVETTWDEEPEPFWQCIQIVGVLLPAHARYARRSVLPGRRTQLQHT